MRAAPIFAAVLVACAACSSTNEPAPGDQTRDAGGDMQTSRDAAIEDPTALVSIRAVLTGAANLAPGETTTAIATGIRRDGTEVELTGAATWSSDAPAIAEALAGGSIRAIAEGRANITATRGEIAGNALAIEVTRAPERTEMRAVWVTRWSFSSIADIDAIAAELDAANINTIFFQTRGTADAYYRSTLEPWAARLSGTLGTDPGWDPLAEMIRAAHARNMQVHAWINTFPAWTGVTTPADSTPRHPLLAHPEWLCADQAGMPMPPASSGYQFFSPGNAEVRAHIASVAQEINDNYEVDGIHMDFIRYPGPMYCHDAASEAAFAAARAGDPTLAYDDFQRDAITSLVIDLKSRVRFLSVASWGVYENIWGWSSVSQGNVDYMQDAHRWGREGLIDALCPMMYWATTEPRGGRLDFQTLTVHHKAAADQGGAWLFTGINAELSLEEIEKQILYSRTASAAGFVIFDFSLIRDRLNALASGVLQERVPPPIR